MTMAWTKLARARTRFPSWLGPVIAAIIAPLLSAGLAGALSIDSLGYWGNAITSLLAFLIASWFASIVAGRHAALSVGIGLGATWGLISLVVLLSHRGSDEPIRSPIVVLIYVLASTLFAYILGERTRRQESHSEARSQ